MSTTETLSDVEQAIDLVKRYAPAGSRIRSVVVDVNRMGDRRRIRFFCGTIDKLTGLPATAELTGYFATILGKKTGTGSKGYGLIIDGGGMDMGFFVMSSVARVVYGDDYAYKQD